MDEKSRLIERLDQARATMRAVLAIVDTHRSIYPDWTIKEVLAHIAGWDDASAASLRAHALGNEPATPAARGIDYYNAESVSTRETLDYDHVVKEWEMAREELKAAINDMPPDKLNQSMLFPWGDTGTIAQLVAIFAGHEKEHAKEIRELVEQANRLS